MNPFPKRLKKEPLIEAIWQVPFESPNAGDALPGLLYAKLRKDYPSLQVLRLPAAEIPPAVAQFDPSLRLAAKVRLAAPEAPFLWQVGDRVVTLNCPKPYVGWGRFKAAILSKDRTPTFLLSAWHKKHVLLHLVLATQRPDAKTFSAGKSQTWRRG